MVNVIVPVHVTLGGGMVLFEEFVTNHVSFSHKCNFIIVNQEVNYAEEVFDVLHKAKFKFQFIQNISPNQGVAVGRNLGLAACNKGELVTFLDFDDKLNKDFFDFIEIVENDESYLRRKLFIFNYLIEGFGFESSYQPPKINGSNFLKLHAEENYTPCLGTTFRYSTHEAFDEDD
ncbi:hypothetical protein [Pseudoalteromonas piscicida]